MSWRDNLHPASFRKAKFEVVSSDTIIGRRNVVHQYPLRDEVYVEDLGLDTDEFSIEGFIVQNAENEQDYFAHRDLLIEELKKSGPGILIHPFYGEKMVSLLGKARIAESFREGGIARFSMVFVKAEEHEAPFGFDWAGPIPVKAVDDAVKNAQSDTIDGFGKKYDSTDSPDFSTNSIMSAVDSLNVMLRSAMGGVQKLGPAMMSKALVHLAEAKAGINLTTIRQTCELGNGLVGMFNGLLSLSGMYGDIIVSQLFGPCSSMVRGISAGPFSGAKVEKTPTTGFQASTMSEPAVIDENLGKSAVRAALAIRRFGEVTGESDDPSPYGGTLEAVSISTTTRARQAANLEATINIARVTAITTAARTAIRIGYSSYDSAIEVLNEVIAALDDLILKLGNDAANTEYAAYNINVADPGSYNALTSLRAVFVESMVKVGADLARIVNYEVPPVILSSLTLAYNQYEDLGRESEIISRNIPLVKNPGFLPQGKELEILSE